MPICNKIIHRPNKTAAPKRTATFRLGAAVLLGQFSTFNIFQMAQTKRERVGCWLKDYLMNVSAAAEVVTSQNKLKLDL